MKRLKIAEQLILVLIVALIVPLVGAAIVVININQHAVRKELAYSATIIAENVYHRILKNIDTHKQSFKNTSKALAFIDKKSEKLKYLNEIMEESNEIKNIELLSLDNPVQAFDKNDIYIYHNVAKKQVVLSTDIDNDYILNEYIDVEEMGEHILESLNSEERQVYVLTGNNDLVMSLNYDKEKFNEVVSIMPKIKKTGIPEIFYKIKNQPNVLMYFPELDWSIIVATSRNETNYGIIKARYKIIFAISAAAFAIFLLCAAYTYSLYINIRQLFKGIKAISMGNYSRKIRLIKNLFTPYETIYLANEFNIMAEKISDSYLELQNYNEKLKLMDAYKSNLIDTVSHELRTPLTSIRGYTSRLLRHDVQLDDETKRKSLKVIKQQAERLSRMVEDLLVVPDIESSLIRVFEQEIILKDVIETSILSTSKKDSRIFNFAIEENFPAVHTDPDRLEQILINLLENAGKYAVEDTEISINVIKNDDFAIIKIHNECDPIDEERLATLFDKFTRVENNLTRTTRGTGLGLYIVKGLVQAIGGEIRLSATDGFEVVFTVPFANSKTTTENENNEEFA
jgi:signal transduction histidine kinase